MNDSRDFQDAETVCSTNSHVTSQPASFPPHPIPGGNAKPFCRNAEPQRRATKHLGHAWYISERFCKSMYVESPHRSETNGIAERAVRGVKEGTSAILLQSGLNESWWANSMECYTYLRNIQDLLSDGKTPYERRNGKPLLKDQSFRLVHWLSISLFVRKTRQESINLERKSYLDCSSDTLCSREEFGEDNVLVADPEELETMDASEIHSKRLNAKEVIFPKQGEFIFPIADGRIKTAGGDQELRTSTLIRPRPIQGEGHVDFLGESEGSLPQPQDSLPDAGEAMHDFWSMSGSFHFNAESNFTRREKNHSLFH